MPSGPRATKGKRMAMKFLNKMSTKDKFSKHIPGLARHSSEEGGASAEVAAAHVAPSHVFAAFDMCSPALREMLVPGPDGQS